MPATTWLPPFHVLKVILVSGLLLSILTVIIIRALSNSIHIVSSLDLQCNKDAWCILEIDKYD